MGGWASCALAALLAAPLVPAVDHARAASGSTGRTGRAEGGPRPELAVYAAASLRDVLTELKSALEKACGATLVFNFAGSNDLARQILAADKADLFISADEGWMDKVAEAGLADRATRRPLLSNRLVVVAPRDRSTKIESAADLANPSVARIAMADPEAVPAGQYAKAWLDSNGLWSDDFRSRILSTADVRAALAAVASGNVDAGVVYRTDAAISPGVRVVYEVPEGDAPWISYPLAVMAHSAHPNAARAAADFLAGPEARAVFERFGFITVAAVTVSP